MKPNFMDCDEASHKWGISKRRIQILCVESRIPGALKKSGVWLIPASTSKPADPRADKPARKFRVVSLFSGCGGLDLGMRGDFCVRKESVNTPIHPEWGIQKSRGGWVRLPRTNFETIFADDIRPDAKEAWCSYFSKLGFDPDNYWLESIVDLVKKEKEGTPIFPRNIDIVTGGFPCQDFSVAGKRLGFNSSVDHNGKKREIDEPTIESRGSLYMWMRDVISILKPKLFIAENVKGLTNLNDVKEIIEHDFASIDNNGYLVIPAKVLLAANFGVPQHRERVIFFGFNKNFLRKEALTKLSQANILEEFDPYPPITHTLEGNSSANLLPFVSSSFYLKDLQEPDISQDVDQQHFSKAKYQGSHCQGQTEISLKSIAPTIRSEHHGNIEFRRLSLEHGGMHIDEIASGQTERRLSVRECARIQTFPDDYHFITKNSSFGKKVSESDAYKLIGNAVPPLLGFSIAMNIQKKWQLYFKKKL